MKKLIVTLAALIVTLQITNAQILSRIEQYGDSMFSATGAGKIKTAMNGTVLLAAYTDNSVGGRLTVSSKDITQGWILYGSPGISTGAPTCLDLTVDWIGSPIVAYADPVTGGKVVIQKWNGSSWGYVGGSTGVTPPNITDVSVSFNTSTGNPSIAYKDPSAGGKITVLTWDGVSWNTIGIPGFSTGAAGYVNISYSPTLTHDVVGYKDSSDMKAHTMYYNGSTWNYLTGGNGFTGGEIRSMDMEIDSASGYPIYAVSEFDGSNYKASVYKHTGSSTVPLGSTFFSPGVASMVNIASDNTGMYLVSFRNATLGNSAMVMYNNGGGWNFVPGSFPTGPIGSCDVSILGCGEFFVTYTDSTYQSQANTRKVSFPIVPPTITPANPVNLCAGSSVTLTAPVAPYANYQWMDSLRWDTVSTPPVIINAVINDLSYAATDYSSNKFVAIKNGANSNKLACYQHGGFGAWNLLGPAALSPGSISYPVIKIAPNNLPYIAYSDGANGSKATVIFYNGSSWLNVGTANFSAGTAQDISMAITQGNKPVVAFRDGASASKLTVMYFNGTNWVILGGAGISAGQANFPCVKISPLGEIYVSYTDVANGSRATVRKWTGSSWATIGTAGFTPASANNTTLDFDGEGNIYLAFSDGAQALKATVMKYNFSVWSTITAGLTPDQAINPKIMMDKSGNTYLSYINFAGGNYYAMISKYNGTAWDTLAHKTVSNTAAGFFDADLSEFTSSAPSCVVFYSSSNNLVGYKFNGNMLPATTNTLSTNKPGIYALHTYNCNYYGPLSMTDAIVQPVFNPSIAVTALQDSVCAGLADTLIASGANTYLWSNASTNDTTVINPSATATYTVTGTDLNGCVGTQTVTVTVPTYGFAGTISYTLGTINNGLVYLLPEEITPGKFDTIAVRSIQTGGTYLIDTIPNGNYLIKAIADSLIYTTTVSTYNGNVGVWDSAQVIPHNCFNRDTVNIQVIEEYLPTGPGLISGTVYEGAGFGLRLAQGPGNPTPNTNVIPGVPIKVGKNPSGAIVGGTTTDLSGHFQFDSLPCDSYYVYTDVPGYPMDTLYKVTISCTGGVDTVMNLDYFIDSNSVYIDLTMGITQGTSTDKNSFITVYPNPSNGFIFLKQNPNAEGDLEVFVTDISGKEVLRKSIRNNATLHTLDLSASTKGVYMLRVVQNGKTSINKIIIY